MQQQRVSVFLLCSLADEALRRQLEEHLAVLEDEQLIVLWHEEKVLAGEDRQKRIDDHLSHAEIILLLISASFLSSDVCAQDQLPRALARHAAGNAVVIPLYLRPVAWERTLFAAIPGLPRGGVPVTLWPNQDEAWVEMTRGIAAVAAQQLRQRGTDAPVLCLTPAPQLPAPRRTAGGVSSAHAALAVSYRKPVDPAELGAAVVDILRRAGGTLLHHSSVRTIAVFGGEYVTDSLNTAIEIQEAVGDLAGPHCAPVGCGEGISYGLLPSVRSLPGAIPVDATLVLDDEPIIQAAILLAESAHTRAIIVESDVIAGALMHRVRSRMGRARSRGPREYVGPSYSIERLGRSRLCHEIFWDAKLYGLMPSSD